jgi:NADPH-dependent 2,4-dienoyl-CoA reductase/sulfur reductase-like enzyme
VFTIRTRGDAEALRRALSARPRRVLIIGAGLIGCEAASCCRDLELPVTLVDPNPTPLARSLGAEIGRTIVERLAKAGVDFRPAARVEALDGDGAGQVRLARFVGGGSLKVDVVIVALGADRDVGWLVAAGLDADGGGLTCDAACRALSADRRPDPHVYAAGDLARWPNAIYGGRHIAVEHWGNAVNQAQHAARNMLAGADDQRAYRHLPTFWSSQFGVNIKCVGLAEGADAVAVVQGSRTSQRFLAVYGRQGRCIAAASFDQARWLPAYARLIEAGAPFPPMLGASDQPHVEQLDPAFPPPRPSAPSGAAHV